MSNIIDQIRGQVHLFKMERALYPDTLELGAEQMRELQDWINEHFPQRPVTPLIYFEGMKIVPGKGIIPRRLRPRQEEDHD